MKSDSGVFMITELLVGANRYQALLKTRRRSWRVDVWAALNSPGINNLPWIGIIDGSKAVNDDDLMALATDLIYRELEK